jgi:hypothetical protein
VEITYQWITVTHLLLQPPHFHPSLCPRRAWRLVTRKLSGFVAQDLSGLGWSPLEVTDETDRDATGDSEDAI